MLAPDIIKRIHSDFPLELVAEVTKILETAVSGGLNVGSDQLARSLLYLCKGNIDVLKNELLPQKNIDPRNIVMWADIDAGGHDHCFGLTFDEIIKFEKGLHIYWNDLVREEEDSSKLIDWSIPPKGMNTSQ